MDKNTISSAIEHPEEAIDSFVKALDAFINSSIANIKKMKQKHTEMGNYWKGEQYNQFTAILEKSIEDATKELREMLALKEQLKEKSKALRNARHN